jgi:transcriptional regulator with XRE-family HTH domain
MVNTPTMGSRLRELRIASGKAPIDVAVDVGVARATLSSYESGSELPGRDTLIALADLFGASLDWITGRTHKINMPGAGQFVDDPDELALLALWRGMDDSQRHYFLGILRFAPPPSGRKSA